MSDKEIKPVHCGCGGEANIHKDDGTFGQMPIYTVSCNTCGMRSGRRSTEVQAVLAWNNAMGERTAKVVDTWKVGGYDELNAWCPECEHRITRGCSYCPTCGVKLDWSE